MKYEKDDETETYHDKVLAIVEIGRVSRIDDTRHIPLPRLKLRIGPLPNTAIVPVQDLAGVISLGQSGPIGSALALY